METVERDRASSARAGMLAGLAMWIGLLQAAPAHANDSSATLAAGGLQLTESPDISMESEDLHISRTRVHVVYRFRNSSDRDISTLVAFPLPTLTMDGDRNYNLEGRDPVNFMDFQVTVEGRRVAPSVEVKATRFGVDVTAVLRRHGIPPTLITAGDDVSLRDRLDKLSAEARQELERHGLIHWHTTPGGRDSKPEAFLHWDTQVTFYWFQTFPAGRSIEVTHTYRPVPGSFFFYAPTLAMPEVEKEFCFDQDFITAAGPRLEAAWQKTMHGYELKYILTTARNWSGPIGRFKLTVEASAPGSLASTCAKGIRRTSPTTLVMTREDFRPDEDLTILFVEPAQPPK